MRGADAERGGESGAVCGCGEFALSGRCSLACPVHPLHTRPLPQPEPAAAPALPVSGDAEGLREREAIRAAWQAVIDGDGWDADVAEGMYARAVEGIAWGLIEATMDTSGREPSAEVYHDARNTARRMMFTLAPRAAIAREAAERALVEAAEAIKRRIKVQAGSVYAADALHDIENLRRAASLGDGSGT